MTNYLIVGGAGFVGSHLTRKLVRQGERVHVIVRPSTNRERLADIDGEFDLHMSDLNDVTSLQRIFSEVRPDVVLHLAATTRPAGNGAMFDDARCALRDVEGFLNVLTAAENTIRPPAIMVRTGTLAEYGNSPHPYREEQREQPMSSYAVGMITATHMADVLQRQLSFPIINARLALTYGTGQSTQFFVPHVIENCLSGKTTRVKYPDERRDLIHIDDVTDALVLLTEKPPVSNRTINIATGIAPTMREVAEMIMEYTNSSQKSVSFGSGTSTHGISHFIGSTELMQSLYGWTAKISFEEGLQQLVRDTRTEDFQSSGAVA